MKKNILLLNFLLICIVGGAQTFTSSKMSMWNFNSENLQVFDEAGEKKLAIEASFRKHKPLNKTLKIISVEGQTYFITREKKGIQRVYTDKWEQVASMTRNGGEITFPHKDKTYKRCVEGNFFGVNKMKYLDEKDSVVASIGFGKNRSFEYQNESEEKTDFLLMALSFHQYHEQVKIDRSGEGDIFLFLHCIATN